MKQDFRRCGPTVYSRFRELAMNPAMWAVFGYRLRRGIVTRLPRPARWLLAPLTIPLQVGIELLTHVQLSGGARIGPGLYLPHLGTVVIGSGSTLGANCTVGHNVTIGHGGGGRGESGHPRIGDRVYVGPGATVIGPVVVADDALIGAGAMVVKDVPPRGVVVGNPARLIGYGGAFALIDYPGADRDEKRAASLAATHDDVRPAGRFPRTLEKAAV